MIYNNLKLFTAYHLLYYPPYYLLLDWLQQKNVLKMPGKSKWYVNFSDSRDENLYNHQIKFHLSIHPPNMSQVPTTGGTLVYILWK